MDLGTTNWSNPTDADMNLRFFVAPGQFATFTIPAKGTAPIPSQFTSAIHVYRDGLVVGGHAPMLVREGQKEQVHPVLRYTPAPKPQAPPAAAAPTGGGGTAAPAPAPPAPAAPAAPTK